MFGFFFPLCYPALAGEGERDLWVPGVGPVSNHDRLWVMGKEQGHLFLTHLWKCEAQSGNHKKSSLMSFYDGDWYPWRGYRDCMSVKNGLRRDIEMQHNPLPCRDD